MRSAEEVIDDHLRRCSAGDSEGDVREHAAEDVALGERHDVRWRQTGEDDVARQLTRGLPGARFELMTTRTPESRASALHARLAACAQLPHYRMQE